jgi:hypothetical protein
MAKLPKQARMLNQVRHAVKRLALIFRRLDDEWLAEGLTALGVARDAVGFVGHCLVDVAEMMPEDPVPLCAACGTEMDDARSDRRYCSPRCRQRGHRSRVASRLAPSDKPAIRDKTGKRNGSKPSNRGRAVTSRGVSNRAIAKMIGTNRLIVARGVGEKPPRQ